MNQTSGNNKAANYGEMVPESWLDVLRDFPDVGENDVFYDLGSNTYKHVPKKSCAYLADSGGRGSLVIQTAIETKMKCVGVELSAKRHAMAVAAKNRLDQVAKVSVNEMLSQLCRSSLLTHSVDTAQRSPNRGGEGSRGTHLRRHANR